MFKKIVEQTVIVKIFGYRYFKQSVFAGGLTKACAKSGVELPRKCGAVISNKNLWVGFINLLEPHDFVFYLTACDDRNNIYNIYDQAYCVCLITSQLAIITNRNITVLHVKLYSDTGGT